MSNFSDPTGGKLTSFPVGLQALAGLVGAGAVMGIAYGIFRSGAALLIVGAGLIVVFLLLLLYRGILGWMRKRRANPLSQGLAGNASATPQNISEPARRARLDDLRRNFEQGIEKFRAAGKNLYSVPWYVIVGEPGSGKTEAIRHCNVGFPPGLQDQLQGAGGTLNMNWWFTNQAIILDTAGRMMFEEVAPGTTNEWNEFLKLLKQNRPNSPLNGMLLVIPVDTLIKDTGEAIDKKAGKIAQQFDQIQRTLGVRFPVFIIITKCDLLNGFREFFDDLNDIQATHQMMGWSNPELEGRFDPAAVTNHLEAVKQRLIERRQHLLLDPVNTEDPQARRVDQVDALYALPDSLANIGPRLRRYLEMIFVAGEWSPKPLFLRGIYFTSSMTEGSALDEELAKVLGLPVDSLPEGRVWRRDRAYFLKDLFIEKVFREKGLVTRASNADKQQRTRRTVILTVGFLSVLLLMGLTWLGYRQLEQSVGKRRTFWEAAASEDFQPAQMPIIQQKANNKYSDVTLKLGSTSTNLAGFFGSNLPMIQKPVEIPMLFKPMAALTGITGKEENAYRALFESTVLAPLYDASRKRMPDATWSPELVDALTELMKAEYAKGIGPAPKTNAAGATDEHPQADLTPLFKISLSEEDFKRYESADAAKLQAVMDWLYQHPGSTAKWPADAVNAGSDLSRSAIDAGINATTGYWKQQAGADSKALAGIFEVKKALDDYRTAEAALLALRLQTVDKIDVYNAYKDSWRTNLAALHTAHDNAMKAWAAVSANKAGVDSLRKIYEAELARITGDAQKAYDALLAYTPSDVVPGTDISQKNPSYQTLAKAREKILAATADLKKWTTDDATKKLLADIGALDAQYLTTIKGPDNASHRRFEVYAMLYDMADKQLVDSSKPPVVEGTLDQALAETDKDYGATINTIKPLRVLTSDDKDPLAQSITLSVFTLETSARAKKFLLTSAAIAALPADSAAWPVAMEARAKSFPPDSLNRQPLPLVKFESPNFSAKYSPDAVAEAVTTLDTVRKLTSANDAGSKVLDVLSLADKAAAVRKGFDAYRESYIKYWRDDVKEEIKFSFPDFKTFYDTASALRDSAITPRLNDHVAKIVAALNRIGAVEDANAIRLTPQLQPQEVGMVLASWGGLDPANARRNILAQDPKEFIANFTVPSAKLSDSYAARYWRLMPLEALSVLAREGAKEITDGLAELALYEKFPLAPTTDVKDDLKLDDIAKARAALEKVRGAAASAGTGVAPAGRVIGEGGVTSDPDVNAILARLRGTNMLKEKQEYLDKLKTFLAAMPDGKPLEVSVTVNKDKFKNPGDATPVSLRFPYMIVSQSKKVLKESRLDIGVLDSCIMLLPAGDITLQFSDGPGSPVLKTETVPGAWSILRMIKNGKATRDGNKWIVEVPVTDPGNTKTVYALWFTVEISKLPDVKDWPVPPAK